MAPRATPTARRAERVSAAHGTGARGAVVVTGTSSGIGEACARRLHELGFSVFAGVRKPEDGERLREATSQGVVPVIIDVTDSASIAAARDQVSQIVGDRGLAGLVNNAGVVVPGPLEFVRIDDLRWQLEVNAVGQIAVTQAFMPALRRATGRVVNIGSIGGRLATAFNGPYNASKHAMEAFSDSLRQELFPWGIRVSLIEPGAIATEIWRKGDESYEQELAKLPPEGKRLYEDALAHFAAAAAKQGEKGVPASQVADAVEHALTARRPRTRYVVGPDARGMAVARRLLPDRLLDRVVLRQLRSAGRRTD
jgi:NAD(P)-dependent dehydrogenase (short-subunit alcohol dehydrogenase family)